MGNAQARGTPEQVQMVVGGLSNPAALEDDAVWREAWKGILPLYFHTYDPQVAEAMDQKTHYSGRGFSHGFSQCFADLQCDRVGSARFPPHPAAERSRRLDYASSLWRRAHSRRCARF